MSMEEIVYKPLFDGLEVSYDGQFRRNGRPFKVIFSHTVTGNKATARIVYMKDYKRHYYQAAKLVAMAWKGKYTEGCNIIYKDENIHNISADNLIIAGDKDWWQYMMRNSGYKGATVDDRKLKLDMVIKEASLTRAFFDTRNFDDINKHVNERLIPVLEEYCLKTIYVGIKTTRRIVPECIARMYECIDNGMCLYNYERYCKKLLLNYKKKGSFGFVGNVPRSIWPIVEQLNLNSLCERYQNVNKKSKSK